MTRVDVKRAGIRLPSGGYGCTRPLAGLGCVCILLGSLAISRWDAIYTIARVGAIVLVVFGSICVLPMLGLWTLRLWVDRFTKKLFHRINHMNEDETLRNQELYAADIQYRPATDADFQGLERDSYDRTSNALADIGCQHLGDVANAKSEQANNAHTVMRIMVSADCKSWIVVRREPTTAPDDMQENPVASMDVVSEFLDGTFCCTSNSPPASPRYLPPQLRMETSAADMPAVEMVHRHEARLRMLTSSDGLVFNTLAEVLASHQRRHALTTGFQKMIGAVDPNHAQL